MVLLKCCCYCVGRFVAAGLVVVVEVSSSLATELQFSDINERQDYLRLLLLLLLHPDRILHKF